MKGNSLTSVTFLKGKVLDRTQLKEICAGVYNAGSASECQVGDTMFYQGPQGCGYTMVIYKGDGFCLYDEPHIETPPPCAYA